jgi:hypothetical protein
MDIHIKYIYPKLNIGMQDIRNVWLMGSEPVPLTPAIHRGSLVYRMPVTGVRISYRQLKKRTCKRTAYHQTTTVRAAFLNVAPVVYRCFQHQTKTVAVWCRMCLFRTILTTQLFQTPI